MVCFLLPLNVKFTCTRKVALATPSGNMFYPPWLLIRVQLDFFPTRLKEHLCDSIHPHLPQVSRPLFPSLPVRPLILSPSSKLSASIAKETGNDANGHAFKATRRVRARLGFIFKKWTYLFSII